MARDIMTTKAAMVITIDRMFPFNLHTFPLVPQSDLF